MLNRYNSMLGLYAGNENDAMDSGKQIARFFVKIYIIMVEGTYVLFHSKYIYGHMKLDKNKHIVYSLEIFRDPLTTAAYV